MASRTDQMKHQLDGSCNVYKLGCRTVDANAGTRVGGVGRPPSPSSPAFRRVSSSVVSELSSTFMYHRQGQLPNLLAYLTFGIDRLEILSWQNVSMIRNAHMVA